VCGSVIKGPQLQSTTHYDLNWIHIKGRNPTFSTIIPKGILIVAEETSFNGFGGDSGMSEWKLILQIDDKVANSNGKLDMVSGKFSGQCFLLSTSSGSMMLQGAGEIKGIEGTKKRTRRPNLIRP
jgi:hypothetical protein